MGTGSTGFRVADIAVFLTREIVPGSRRDQTRISLPSMAQTCRRAASSLRRAALRQYCQVILFQAVLLCLPGSVSALPVSSLRSQEMLPRTPLHCVPRRCCPARLCTVSSGDAARHASALCPQEMLPGTPLLSVRRVPVSQSLATPLLRAASATAAATALPTLGSNAFGRM